MSDKLDAGPFWGNSSIGASTKIVECEWFIWKACYDALRAEIERLTEEVALWRRTAESARQDTVEALAEIERLRVFLKHLKGVAQDSDDIPVMDEIDANGRQP